MITKLLLVDDEVPFVEAMTKRLTRRGLMVKTAFSGHEALERLHEDPHIDVVILDVKMPGMDGTETLRAIKSGYPMVEVIMLTGHATVESAVEGMRLGALDYLMKPCDNGRAHDESSWRQSQEKPPGREKRGHGQSTS